MKDSPSCFRPDEGQSGVQAGHVCQEQIMILRLLIDYARKKKILYMTFIDYQKVYDKVNYGKLLQILADVGCVRKLFRAVGESLRPTSNILGFEIFEASEGVR